MSRRSVRLYDGRPVPRELTLELVELATHAPSNFNRQPWHFVVADTPAWCRRLTRILFQALDEAARADEDGELFNFLDHTRTWADPLLNAPVLVLAFYKPHPERFEQMLATRLGTGDTSLWSPNLMSLSMAVQNLLLAVHARGLSACMHSGPVPLLRGQVNRLLSLPPNLQMAGLISMGWPAEAPEPPGRRPLERMIRFLDGEPPPEGA